MRHTLSAALVGVVSLLAADAAAHIQPIVGRIVDVVRQSDIVVIGTVRRPTAGKSELIDVAVAATVLGNVDIPLLTFGCKARLPLGERQVVFLSRTPEGLRCVQPSGTQFPAEPADDGDYTRAVRAIADALRLPEAKQVTALRAALIPALRANAMELRYHAGLELAALAHPGHPLTAEARQAIEAARADANLDPTLRPLLDRALRADP